MRIFIGADLVPTESNFDLFTAGNAQALVGKKIKNIMDSCDYRIFNNELALTDEDTPIKKAGPNIGAPTSTVNGIKALGVNLLGIANNHILDHGYQGFISTLNALDKAGIAHVGGGLTREEAKKPYFYEKDNLRVGIYACCEHEFSWFDDYGFGANGFDPLESLDDIVNAKKECDYLIVLYHGGKEHYAYPSPHLARVCRKIIEKGGDLVLCQHTHCVGAEENFNSGKIIYGQGNFIFAKNYANIGTWGPGFAIIADICKEGVKFEYVPYNLTDFGIEYDESGEILKGLRERSEKIKEPGFINNNFEKMAEETVMSRYVQHIVGHMPTQEEMTTKQLIRYFHFAECDVHHECLLTGLRKLAGLGRFGEFKKDKND